MATGAYKLEEIEMGVIRNLKIHVPVKEYAVYEKGDGIYISILGKDASIHVFNTETGEKVLGRENRWEELHNVDLKNGLTKEENEILFHTVYVDEALQLILKGLQAI